MRQREWCPTVSSTHTRQKVSPVASDSRKVEHLQGRVGNGDDAGGGGELPKVDMPLETKL